MLDLKFEHISRFAHQVKLEDYYQYMNQHLMSLNVVNLGVGDLQA